MMPWGLILRAVALVAVIGAVWYAKHSYDERRRDEGRAEVRAAWDAERARQTAALEHRRADDARADQILRARAAEAAAALAFAHARVASLEGDLAAEVARWRAAGLGAGHLPATARGMWRDAVESAGGGRPANVRPPATVATDATGGVAGAGPAAANDLAPPVRDAEPVECVTVFEVGARNTARAAYNAAALMACQRDQIALWEACTGQQYPTATAAPWLQP